MFMFMFMLVVFLLRIGIQLLVLPRIEARKTTHSTFLLDLRNQSKPHLPILKQILEFLLGLVGWQKIYYKERSLIAMVLRVQQNTTVQVKFSVPT